MKILDKRLHYHDVMIVPQVSDSNYESRAEVSVTRTYKSKYGKFSFNSAPVCVANMDTCGSIKMAGILEKFGGIVALHKFYPQQDLLLALNKGMFSKHFFTVGLNDISKLEDLMNMSGACPDLICLDTPNGYLQSVVDTTKKLRVLCPNSFIMVGNVVTSTATVRLIEAGADCAKVGISQGGLCHTYKVTGVGYPQLSATIECASAAHKIGGYICADGGIKNIGDICKSLVGGADMVMAGSIFMGFDENEGEWLYNNTSNEYYLKVYGMSSREAQEKYYQIKDYRASEGDCKLIKNKGPVENFFKEVMGGIRSCATYIGAQSVKDFNKCGDLVIC